MPDIFATAVSMVVIAEYGHQVIHPQWQVRIYDEISYAPGNPQYQPASTRDDGVIKAHAKSQELFKRTLGVDAFKTLLWGGSIPVKGSEGGNYLLQCKYSHCVVDIDRGMSLCAIVPGVPLWDHLLGIKLMIENDEKRFRKVAHSEYATDCDYVIPQGRY